MNPTEPETLPAEGALVATDEPPTALPISHAVRGRRGRLLIPVIQALVVVVVGVVIVTGFSHNYLGGVFVLALTYALVTVGMAAQIGFSQQVAFSQAVFMGFGAYGVAVLNGHLSLASFWASLIVTVVGAVLALLIGSVVCRARGLALPVATIMFPLIAGGFVGGWNFLGGTIGLPITGNLWPFAGTMIGNGLIVVAFVALGVFYISRILTSQHGLELFVLGVNDATAAAMGVSIARRKLELFVIGSTLATLGGALYAGSQLFVPQTLVTAPAQLSLLLMLFIGGRRSVLGAVVGAFLIQYVAGISNFVSIHILLIEGAVVTIVLLIEPEGLAGIANTFRRLVVELVRDNPRAVPAAAPAGADPTPAAPSPAVSSPGAQSAASAAFASPARAGAPTGGAGLASGGELLVVENLSKSFGGLQVLEAIDFSLPEHGIFGLCGPNGAGKSTLLNIVGGSIAASAGRVLLGGTDVTNRPAEAHFDLGVARTFQAVHLVPGRTALENVAVTCLDSQHKSLALAFLDNGMPQALEKAEAALEFLGIEELRDRDVNSLTLEGQRMVELARAIAPQPRLLLLDEPASGLSESQRDALRSTLRNVSTITSILLVEHDLQLVAEIAERIFVLVTGRLLFEGNGAEFYSSELVQSVLIGSSHRNGAQPEITGEGRQG